MLYNEIKNEEGVNAMTNENYISYLVGTANGYPSKTQRYLKMLFSTAGIAVPDDQISIPFDVDTTVNIKDKELSEQIAMCLEQSASARRIFEKWEFEKDYKYSVLFTTPNFDDLQSKTESLDQYNENDSEESRSQNGFSSPLCLKSDNLIFLKFSLYYSAVETTTGNESLVKYPILVIFHCNEKIIEFRFDTLRRIFVPERQEQSFYSDLIDKLIQFWKTSFGTELEPLNLEFLQKHHPDATLMAKYMMLPSGGNAQLDVGKNENYILPIIGELKEILNDHRNDLDKCPALKESLEQFMFENDELSECTWIEIMWENEIKVRSIRVKFIFNYKNRMYCLLQHYYSNVLVGMERMNHVVRYISKHTYFLTSTLFPIAIALFRRIMQSIMDKTINMVRFEFLLKFLHAISIILFLNERRFLLAL